EIEAGDYPTAHRRRSRRIKAALAVLVVLVGVAATVGLMRRRTSDSASATVVGIEPIGHATLPPDLHVDNTLVGGLSGLAFDAADNIYYAVADEAAAPRY